MKVSYNWLKEYLGEDIPEAAKLAELLTFHAFEIESVETVGEDSVIDVDVLPNRSSDCLSHRGIARELATLLNQPLVHDPLRSQPSLPSTDLISVQISAPEACPRFTASLITGVTVGPSPQWLQDRLLAIGQRPINNIVDATNYVMFALGQPLHAYDAELFPQVDGQWQFLVRLARPGEQVSLIPEGGKSDDRVIECAGTELLIVDASSDTPIGLAGVKGGRFAGVHAGTTQVIIEAAHFDPTLTRKTARGLGIVIDASKRFENEPARVLPPFAQAEITTLIAKIAGGESEGMIDVFLEPKEPPTVTVSVAHVNSLLGLSLPVTEMVACLERAGITVLASTDVLTCTGPLERTDLLIAEDFIEEIGRIHGYSNVTAVVPEATALQEINTRHYYSELVRRVLLDHGFSEVITSSFAKTDQVQLKNALAADKTYLRSTLSHNITAVLDANAGFSDLLGTHDTRVFEIGTVFTSGGEFGISEHTSLCIGVRLRSSGYSGKEDAILKEVLAALEAALQCTLTYSLEQGVIEVQFSELIASLPTPTAYQPVQDIPDPQYRPFSLYPHISRDIALWVAGGTTAAEVETIINEASGPLRVRTTFLDEFHKDGRTSYAFRLVFQSKEKTLTDEEVNQWMESVYKTVTKAGFEVR